MWKFLVKNQSIEILEREVLADHQIQYVQLKFTFDGDWRRFHKVVQFSQCDETYNIVLGTDSTSLYLPAELHVGAAKMSVFGYDTESDTTVRATTVPVTLIIFMGIDFATGMINGAMGKSKHSKSGKLNSMAGWYGLAKKCSILMLIIVAVRLDILLNTNYVRDAVCIGFCVNELLSIVENTSLMGIPYPPALKNAIEVLQKQTGRKDDKDD